METQITSSPEVEPAGTEPAVLLTWEIHPAAARPFAALAVFGYVFAAGAVLQHAFGSPGLTLLATLILTAVAAEYLFPSHYSLTAQGVECRGPSGVRKLAWSRVRGAWLLDDGLRLSPRAQPGRFARRGLYLPFADHRETILALVDQHAVARQTKGTP